MSFPGFDCLSPTVYRNNPSASRLSGDATAPSLIIIATWANAPPKLVTYYTTAYRKLFPASTILLITTTFAHVFYTSTSTYHTYLVPILPILESIKGPIVAAVFSNGGAFALTSLARLYASKRGQPLPIRDLIIDSAPGSADVSSAQQAILASSPPSFQRFPFRHLLVLFIRIFFTAYLISLGLRRQADPLTTIRRDLLDERLFLRNGRRTYIYSKEDKIIDSEAVELHADETEARGWAVRREEWKGSEHVAHARMDGERYWAVVKATLMDGMSKPLKAKL